MNSKRLLSVDLETTGVKGDVEILQVAARLVDIVYDTGKIDITPVKGGALVAYVEPERTSAWPEAMACNHITPEMVKGAYHISELMPYIQRLADLSEGILVYNGGSFDIPLLKRYGLVSSKPLYDVMLAYDDYRKEPRYYMGKLQQGYKWFSLTNACSDEGISSEGAHNAFCDIQMMESLFCVLYKKGYPVFG